MMIGLEPLLQAKRLQVSFETARGLLRAVDGVDLDVRAGEVLGVVGESGSGKSVTLRSIARILHANARVEGEVYWRGGELPSLDDAGLPGVGRGGMPMILLE